MTHDIKQKQPIHRSSSGDFSQAVRDEENISFQSPVDKQPSDMERLETARESFSGRLLTDPQFAEIISITQILEREIFRSGSFKDKLADYCHAMSRSEKMDVKRLETIIRDLFKERVKRQTIVRFLRKVAYAGYVEAPNWNVKPRVSSRRFRKTAAGRREITSRSSPMKLILKYKIYSMKAFMRQSVRTCIMIFH